MIRFRDFITESVRQGLPHIHSTLTPAGNPTPSLSTDQFEKTTRGGKLHINDVTEKTDGQTFRIGHDDEGFYTQHSGSGDERIRTGQGHIDRAKRRAKETGKEYDPTAPEAFAKFHDALHRNEKLQDHLKQQYKKNGHITIKGEAFNNALATPSDVADEVKFVHTSYAKPKTSHGTFVIHSKLPGNEHVDLDHFKNNLSNNEISFDDDVVNHKPGHVDVKDEVSQFSNLDHGLINSRTTKTNKQDKLAEIEKFNNIKKKVSAKVEKHLKHLGVKNKWGSGSEGLIVHPSQANPEAARFKVTSTSFKQAKAGAGRFGGK